MPPRSTAFNDYTNDRDDAMPLIFETVQRVRLDTYIPEFNGDGTEKHIVCNGARFHVLSYSNRGVHCSEPKCEINRQRERLNNAIHD